MAAEDVTEIRVLAGTVSVTTAAGGPVEPRGKTAQLLGLLVSRAGQPVAVTDIIRAVWPEAYDPGLVDRKQVEKLVSGLRNLLGPTGRAAIPPRKHDRYRFDPDAGNVWVDALELDRLARSARAGLDAGDPGRARADALHALDLWKSDPVVLPVEWKHLPDRHRAVRLCAAEAAVGLATFAAAVVELEDYLADHPDDERGWELLVEACLRGGRPAQARRACAEAAASLGRTDTSGGRLAALCSEADVQQPVPAPGRPAPAPDSTPAEGREPGPTTGLGPRGRGPWPRALAVGAGAVGLAALVAVGVVVRHDRSSSAAGRGGATTLAFDFDGGLRTDAPTRYVVDATGTRRGYEAPTGNGAVTLVDHGPGKAMKFPPPCGGPRTTAECPGAVIDVADAGFLNPGTRPFSFGAEILVGTGDAARGTNILQKGNGLSPVNDAPNQWKLELGNQGEARCVLVTRATSGMAATSKAIVTDGNWHRVRCTRTATALSVEVDAADPVTTPLPADLKIASPGLPVRLGGSNRMGIDRFTGAVDNVYYRLG